MKAIKDTFEWRKQNEVESMTDEDFKEEIAVGAFSV